MELLSQRAFAKEIGRSNVWVSKLVKQGKIPLVDGKIPLAEGLKAYEASQQLGYDTNRELNAQKRKATPKKAPKKTEKSNKKSEEPFTLPDDDQLPSTGTVSVDRVAAAFNKARLAEKTYQAKLRELEFKEKQGLFIQKEEIEADARNTAEELRGLLIAIPAQISDLCEGKEAREIEGIIEDAINNAMKAMNKSRFAKA
jgi:hypothetical protein